MKKEAILTDEEIITIGQHARAIESGESGYILPIAFARAIEQAVLRYNAESIRALLAERDALRDALETMVEMVEMNGFGRDYAMDVARAALAQGQGERDA